MEDEDATAADDSAVPPTAATSTKTKQPRRGPQLPTKPGSKTAAANNRTSDILAAAAAVATGTGGVGTFPQQHAQKPSPLGSHAASLAASLTMLADLGVDIKDITIPLPIPGVEGDTGGGQLQTLDLTDMQSLTALFPDVSPEELRQILLLDETSGVASADMMLQLQVDENGVNLPPPDGTDPTGQPGGGGVPTFGLPAQTWGRRAAARTRAAHPHLPHPRHPPPSEYKEQQHYTYTTYADNLAYPNILLPPFRMPPVKQILYGPYEAALWRYLVARQVRVVRLAVERERARSAGMRVEVELEGVGV
ncbi:uncharacterized protein EV422DRAFT_518019 [Fimicolochytrium jonesii]|uniref:uncharacterized protein n=1 Tax=Fimicolochytrium jonesii TaxID=1396493 RepID=UPI0022FF144E|nr:uncharacterized protein EV422DRAFT_518019 [Fimicolochytrium jonesii]KAI8825232.1 hypothetical protein EV422DRAFT_518019 [Fimicolochytrium jonesii]